MSLLRNLDKSDLDLHIYFHKNGLWQKLPPSYTRLKMNFTKIQNLKDINCFKRVLFSRDDWRRSIKKYMLILAFQTKYNFDILGLFSDFSPLSPHSGRLYFYFFYVSRPDTFVWHSM